MKWRRDLGFKELSGEAYPEEIEAEPEKIERVVVCSGQVYYDILEKRRELKFKPMAIIRIEQLAPFPYDHFKAVTLNYKNAHFIWCQETPEFRCLGLCATKNRKCKKNVFCLSFNQYIKQELFMIKIIFFSFNITLLIILVDLGRIRKGEEIFA